MFSLVFQAIHFWESVLECHTSKCDLKLNIIIAEETEKTKKKTQTVQFCILIMEQIIS